MHQDTARLNYLETGQHNDIHFYMSVKGPRWKIGNQYNGLYPWHSSLREAIDDAMAKIEHTTTSTSTDLK